MSTSPLSRLETQMIWSHVLGVSRAWLIAHDTDTIDEQHYFDAMRLQQRRLQGEPMAYILGCKEFMSRMFQVNDDVLIPRPETELLAEHAINELKNRVLNGAGSLNVLDLGTGSGALAVTIALEVPDAHVYATDVSEKAIKVAKYNALNHGAKVEFFIGNWYHALPEGMDFDVIVSNPPYIATSDSHLSQGDVRFEPQLALVSGADGLNALRTIVGSADRWLRKGGCLFMEHGWDQSDDVSSIMSNNGFTKVQSLPDLAGHMRITGGFKN